MTTTGDVKANDVKLICFGNAILDVGKRLNNKDLHDKYNLQLDDQLELDATTLQFLKKDLDEVEGVSHVTSGGSCLNTCKILSQLGEHGTLFCGGIGADENGELLQGLLDKSNIRRRLQKLDHHPTALCICLIHKESRCLLANIGASTHFNSIAIVEELASAIQPTLCYIEGYFIPHKMSICKLIFDRFCQETKGLLVLNLNATYIVSAHPEDVLWLFERAHIIFGNRREFDELLRVAKQETIPQLLEDSQSDNRCGMDRDRTCVITDGERSIQYVRQTKENVKVGSLMVPKVAGNLVMDSTGAGDAFVAGFLYLYLKQRERKEISLEQCIRNGVEVAQRKLAYRGCTLLD